MKRYGYIYEKICDIENIKAAIINASTRKKNRRNVQRVLANLDKSAEYIQKLLIEQTYEPAPYKEFSIFDGATKKERVIYRPEFFPDQCIHWALILQIEPLIMKGMYKFSCGSIPGRGVIYGQKYIKKWIRKDRKNTKYYLKLDIRKFYPSINNEMLKAAFRKKIKDAKVLWLIDKIIDSHPDAGVPIGNYTSQWFANFFLQELDHFVKENLGVKYYMRYMDDMVLFGCNKKKLHKARAAIAEYLKPMGLELKGNWQLARLDDRAVDYLGFRFFRHKTILRKRNALRIRRRIKKVWKKPKPTYSDAAAVLSYLGWLKHSDSYHYYQKYVKPYINIKRLKEVIRNENKKQCHAGRCL